MSRPLLRGDVLSASTVVRAEPAVVFSLLSDPTRIPSWSPECVRVEWLDNVRFRGWNRRGLGRWSTVAHIVTVVADTEFSFVVQALGKDFTQWTYRTEPGPAPGTTLLTQTLQMAVDLNLGYVLFERWVLGVRDRRADLQSNLEDGLTGIRRLLEA